MTGISRIPPYARSALLATVVVVAPLAIYLSRLDQAVGLTGDDGWYVLLAKALASGEPFGMVNSPLAGSVTPYPPGFPLVLAIVFRFDTAFPENVWLLKSVSIAAMLGVGVASYLYLVRQRGLTRSIACACALAIVLTPAFVFLATSTVMSEGVFTLAQLLAVILLGSGERERHPRRYALLAGAAAAAATLVRSAGISVIAAGIAYLLYRKQWRRAVLFTAAALIVLAPWFWYSGAQAPTMTERLAHGGGHALSYGQNFWLRVASHSTSGTITAGDLPGRVAANLREIAALDVGGIIVPALFRGATESGQEVIALGSVEIHGSMGSATGTMMVSLALCAIAVLGFAIAIRRGPTAAEFVVVSSMAITVLWPFWPYRFILPLTPFLFLYLVIAIQLLASRPAVLRIALLSVIGLHLLDHTQYVMARRAAGVGWEEDAAEVESVLAWMNSHLTESGHVATTSPALVHLRTGRKTVAIDNAAGNWRRWKQLQVRYLVCLTRAPLPPAYGPYRVLYQSPRQGLWILEI